MRNADARRIARGIAATRVLLGIAIVVAPRVLMRSAVKDGEPSDEAVAALRMAGGRDLALGLGALLAAKRGPRALRGWVEGGMLADAIDVPSLAAAGSLRPVVRGLGLASAAAAAALGALVARRLAP
ncbi:MAG: hypothetical protein ACRD0K_07965 [Egibacteraceae bacterium]